MTNRITLRAARVNSGLTQKEVADMIGVSQYSIGNWESGDQIPNVKNFRDMCFIYGFDESLISLPYEFAESELDTQ